MHAPRRRRESGTTLIWSIVALAVVGGLVAAGTGTLRATSSQVETTFRQEAQAVDIARAGLIDAFAWFRRQPNQPVAVFDPQLDLAASPPVNETDEPWIGLVREFDIAPGFVGRYEVRRWVDKDGNGTADSGEGVSDLSALRGQPGAGTVWLLEAHGIVYRQVDPLLPWYQEPNYRIAGAVATTEIRQLAIVPPGDAALCCATGSAVTAGTNARILASHATGILYPTGSGPASTGGSQITADYAQAGIPDFDASWAGVFGSTQGDLRDMATVRLEPGEAIPSPLPDFAVVFAEGDVTVTSAAPLVGTGLVIVNGDLTLASGNNSFFTGVIYVTGNYTQAAPSLVRGTVIVLGSVNVSGAGDISELQFDASVTSLLNGNIGPYRLSRGIRRLDSTGVGGEAIPEVR